MTSHTEKSLIKTLRIKFIAIIVSIAALILAASFSFVCWYSNNQNESSVYAELTSAAEAVAHSPLGLNALSPTNDSQEFPNDEGDGNGGLRLDRTGPKATAPDIGSNQSSWQFPLATYCITSDGQTSAVAEKSTAVVNEDSIDTALEQALSSTSTQGYLRDVGLFFARSTSLSGTTFVTFADKNAVSDWTELARTLALVGLVVITIIFLFACQFSQWALRPVRQAWEAQQQFIADASHEMKTPITVILANAELALRKPEASIAQQSQWIEGIQDEARSMEELVLDLLTLAQPDVFTKESTTQTESVNLSELAEGSSLQFEAVAFERQITLESRIAPNVFVEGNPAKLQRLLGILIDNACKYAPANSSVVLTLSEESKAVRLSVNNQGDVIAPEDLPHLFDRFYRSDKARDRSGDDGDHSFGLGLAIAQKIVLEHGGRIDVTSEKEAGTTFTVILPQ